jgi:hypothetical protein
MVAMAVIVRLPVSWIAGLGVAMILFHNLLDPIAPAALARFSGSGSFSIPLAWSQLRRK